MTVSIEAFLAELDRQIEPSAEPLERLDLFHIGRSALVMHHGSTSSTSDFDVVQMDQRLESIAIELFGKGTSNAQRLGMYLELVPQGIPPVPQNFRGHCTEVAGPWRVLRLWRLDPHDLAVTKLKSFRPQDREDLQYLCDGGLIQEAPLTAALESAFLWSDEDDRPRVRAFKNLGLVLAYLQGRRPAL